MNLKTSLAAFAAAIAVTCLSGAAHAVTYTYVGSWHVGDGPVWTSNPAVYTGQETAALLFGGSPSDYAISTVDNNPLNINFMAFADGWGDTSHLFSNPVAQNYSLTLGTGYNDPFGGPAFSTYVLDHSCFNRYGDASQSCDSSEPGLNYAFRSGGAVPEPGTWGLMVLGIAGLGASLRMHRRAVELLSA